MPKLTREEIYQEAANRDIYLQVDLGGNEVRVPVEEEIFLTILNIHNNITELECFFGNLGSLIVDLTSKPKSLEKSPMEINGENFWIYPCPHCGKMPKYKPERISYPYPSFQCQDGIGSAFMSDSTIENLVELWNLSVENRLKEVKCS